MSEKFKSKFEEDVKNYCVEFGGMKNMHVHGDRAYTNRDIFYQSTGKSVSELMNSTLPEKQKLTWTLHKGPAFEEESIEERMKLLFENSIAHGIKEIWTTVDTTYNSGLRSLEVAEKLKKEYLGKIVVRIGAYNPSGFRKGIDSPERFEIFEEAASRSDFLMGLAEKDRSYGHIGEEQHNFYLLELSHKLGKPVHFHVGQENRPTDKTLELLIENVETFQDKIVRVGPNDFPEVIAVHGISTSCLPYEEFDKTAKKMSERKIGLISCPRAAISMKQDVGIESVIHNSIGNVWRFAISGVSIKGLGTDNVDDIFIPNGTADIYDEGNLLADSLRFYGARIIAKLMCGVNLDEFDRGTLVKSLFPNLENEFS